MKTKWFNINKRKKILLSIRKAKNPKEAWDKTFMKWEWLIEGYKVKDSVSTCGLCDIHKECFMCPILEISESIGCLGTPYPEWYWASPKDRPRTAEIEYMFLLFVRLATEEDGP